MDFPTHLGPITVVWIVGLAGVLYALHQVWRYGIKPIARFVHAVSVLPTTARDQVIEWADESASFVEWKATVDERFNKIDGRFDTIDVHLESIDRAVNHRGIEGPTLSRESAETAATLAHVADTVERIAQHVGLPTSD